jgi:hypothetical protein
LGIAERFEALGPVSRYLLFEKSEGEVGLALMPKESEDINFAQMTGASNKVFDYLACGLALLVSDLPDWRGLYVAPGYGLSCDPEDPETIAAALRWFLDHPEETQAMGEAGRQRILKEWNYETQFHPVWQLLNHPRQMRPSCPSAGHPGDCTASKTFVEQDVLSVPSTPGRARNGGRASSTATSPPFGPTGTPDPGRARP